MNIVIIGMKHCGKSTQSRMLAERFGVKAIDTDLELERDFAEFYLEKLSFREIYQKRGAEFFRQFEADTLNRVISTTVGTSLKKRHVIALGGGTVSNPYLPADWTKLGFIVYLKCSPEVLFARIKRNGLPPYLAEASDPYQEFLSVLKTREADFEAVADLVFEVDSNATPAQTNASLYQVLNLELED